VISPTQTPSGEKESSFMTTAKHIDALKPHFSKTLEAAIKSGSGALDDLSKMLDLARKSGDAGLIEQIESRISNDADKVKEHFSTALVAVANELGLAIQLKPKAGLAQVVAKKPRKQRVVKGLTPEQRTEGEKHLPKLLKVLPQVHADKSKNVGKGQKDQAIAQETGLNPGQVKLARRVGQEQGKIVVKGVWGGAFKV
jgi:hypothetical protein